MPTYAYHCSQCGSVEAFQRMSDAPLTVCPECGTQGLKKEVTAGAGAIFKGGGFYQTDYRSDSYKKAAKADSKTSDSGSDGKSEKKTSSESKPAAKATESKPAAKKKA